VYQVIFKFQSPSVLIEAPAGLSVFSFC
jgi:hypothetical protein